MKFFATSVISSVLILTLLSAPVLAAKPTPASTTSKTSGAVMGIAASLTPTPTPKVDYLLPYPGILPDHPLYFLKAFRDRILEALIVDPLRKAEFYLLQADKRVGMAMFAADQGKVVLVDQSATIAEANMARTITLLGAFKSTGGQVPGNIIDRLERSTARHVEVLEGLLAKAGDANRAGISAALDQVKKLQGEVGNLK